MSTLKTQRLLFLILAIAVIFSGVYVLLIYEAVYYLSFEYLNSKEKYRKIKAHTIYNWLYIAYLAFEVLVRSDIFHFSERINYHVNTVEHLFFTFLISLTISIYLGLFNLLPHKYLLKLVTVFVILNVIGIINEYFQNIYQLTPIFCLEETDIKDIVINLIGSSLFVVFSLILNRKKMRKFIASNTANQDGNN